MTLDEYLAEPATQPGFIVDDDGKADWALRKLAGIRSRIAEVQAQADAERQRIDEWLARVTEPMNRDAEFFIHQLDSYARIVRGLDDRKTIDLPNGVIKTVFHKPKITVTDEAALLAWVKEHAPDCVVVKETVAKSEVSKIALVHAEVDGELLPGIEVGEAGVRVTVTT